MQGKGEEEEQKEGQTQGMFINRMDHSAMPDGPGRIMQKPPSLRLLIDRFLPIRVFGFGGTFLEQENGEDHIKTHLQEFAFPILSDRLPEMGVPQVREIGLPGFMMLGLVLVEGFPPRQAMAAQAQKKKQEVGQGQSVVFQEPGAASCGHKYLSKGNTFWNDRGDILPPIGTPAGNSGVRRIVPFPVLEPAAKRSGPDGFQGHFPDVQEAEIRLVWQDGAGGKQNETVHFFASDSAVRARFREKRQRRLSGDPSRYD